MAVSTLHKDINRGPLKLDHDGEADPVLGSVTPRGAHLGVNGGHGFKGFPGQNFEKGRDLPPFKSITSAKPQSHLDEKYHGVSNWLDTNNPTRLFGNHQGIQYGSDGFPVNKSQPRGIGDPFNNKSSADLAKFHRQMKDAQQDFAELKSERMLRHQAREDEKKKDLEMLTSYNPWGKAGGGAPALNGGDGHKKQRALQPEVLHNNVEHTTVGVNELKAEYGDFNARFGMPGNGAPLRTKSGKVKTEIKGDTAIRFQDTQTGRRVNDVEVRYKAPTEDKERYQKELDVQIQQRKLKDQEDRIKNLKSDLQTIQHDPYNKPGAGAPNKTNSADPRLELLRHFYSKSEDKRNGRPYSEVEGNSYNPWGKGVGQPQYNRHGDTERHKHSNSMAGVFTTDSPRVESGKGVSLELASYRGGAGAPLKTESGNIKAARTITLSRNEKGDTTVREEVPGRHKPPIVNDDPDLQVYDPWGKGGGGAPLKDNTGNVRTSIYGTMQSERLSGSERKKKVQKDLYRMELQKEMEEQKGSRNFERRMDKIGMSDMATVMKQGQVGNPRRDPDTGALQNQHLGMTDVTREKVAERKFKNEASQDYYTELEKAANQRKFNRGLDKFKENQEDNQHQQAFSQFWGKPGAGAPNDHTRKIKLDDKLYSPRKEKDYHMLVPYATEKSDYM